MVVVVVVVVVLVGWWADWTVAVSFQNGLKEASSHTYLLGAGVRLGRSVSGGGVIGEGAVVSSTSVKVIRQRMNNKKERT